MWSDLIDSISTIDFAGIPFEVLSSLVVLQRVTGLYAVLGMKAASGYPIINIGVSVDFCARVKVSCNKDCWQGYVCVAFAMHRMARSPRYERLALESLPWKNFNPPCG
jgi:hypothetical protein